MHNNEHLRVYNKYFDIDSHNKRRCELTGSIRNVDVTHIDASGMGGRESAHVIDNLMCLTRLLHNALGDKTEYKEMLKEAHAEYMETRIPLYYRSPGHKLMFIVYEIIGNS